MMWLFTLWILIIKLLTNIEAGNVLIFPMLSRSQLLNAARIGSILSDDGHNFTMVLPTNDEADIKKSSKYNLLFYKTEISREDEQKIFKEAPKMQPIDILMGRIPATMVQLLSKRCEGVLFDDGLHARLSEVKPDVAIVHTGMACVIPVLEQMGVPFIDFCSVYLMHALCGYPHSVPAPPSYVPDGLFADEPSTFFDRVLNTLVYMLAPQVFPKIIFGKAEEQALKYQKNNNLPEEGLMALRSKASALLVHGDITFESIRPSLPKVVYIGGIQCDSPKPLDDDLRDFVEGGSAGLIVFSLGGVLNTEALPDNFIKTFLDIFRVLPQRVVWKLKSVPTHLHDLVPSNVKIVDWMPQQDLLGHASTVLFISHGGIQGSFESICHGVPMLGVNIFGDQKTNIKTLVNKGMALMIEDYKVMKGDDAKDKINKLLFNKAFKEKAVYTKELYNDQPLTVAQRLAFIVGYVIRHKGAKHLTSINSLKLHWLKYHSFDVYLFLLFTILFVIYILFQLVKFLINIVISFCTGRKKTKEE